MAIMVWAGALGSPLNVAMPSALFGDAGTSSGLSDTRMVEPGPAPSIIRPMIELPFTDWPSRTTLISASKHSAVRTKRAEARAWRPLRLTMVICCASARPPFTESMAEM